VTIAMNKLDTEKILFEVDEDNNVVLWVGAFAVTVCSRPEDFKDFMDDIAEKLEVINKELKEYHCD